MERYLAHLSEDRTRTQTVYEHLAGTAKLDGEFASAFDAQAEGTLVGWSHDIGKYSAEFQRRFQGGCKVDHSTAGAKELLQLGHMQAAFAVAGHHSGIPDGGNKTDAPATPTLIGRCKNPNIPDYSSWKEEVTLPVSGVPAWAGADPLSYAFFTRMLYSCLVDADFLDTETFMNNGVKPRGTGEPLSVLLEKVRAQAKKFLKASDASLVSQQRNAVLRACLEKGASVPQGLYTLTVPTGGGKTFSSLAFAMEHAAAQQAFENQGELTVPHKKRIIYVIPYMSIIDQTALQFSELLGAENVLADFSSAEYKTTEQEGLTPEQYRHLLASENWDAPVIVTTAVQFFESLYANRSGRCRKLHNIADSVIIFDEAQTLPSNYLKPCISAIAQLIQHYHVTAVLCTATQPPFASFFQEFAPELHAQELSPDSAKLYEVLRRTTILRLPPLSQENLAAQLSELPQVLCVVNRRRTAQELYTALPDEGSYCLTTLLCAADRRKKLDEIRQRLHDGLPCRVVSTSLIEAGVDVDFPAAYRELCGLDSLLQTAGRCNREGKYSAEDSKVFCFQIDGLKIPDILEPNSNALNYTAEYYPTSLDTRAAISTYFNQLYDLRGDASFDQHRILDAFRTGISGCRLPFAQVAEKFHLIQNAAHTVYIPIGKGAELCERLRRGFVSRALLRQLGIYSVSCYDTHFRALRDAGALEILPSGAAILTDLSKYSEKTGLSMDIETVIGLYF